MIGLWMGRQTSSGKAEEDGKTNTEREYRDKYV